MTAAQQQETTTLDPEVERIEAWRVERLERAGYSRDASEQLAARHDIDLHRAVDLLGAGCPADIALRILL
jgi:hypothetical protein